MNLATAGGLYCPHNTSYGGSRTVPSVHVANACTGIVVEYCPVQTGSVGCVARRVLDVDGGGLPAGRRSVVGMVCERWYGPDVSARRSRDRLDG